MKKKDIAFFITFGLLIIGIILLVLFKFVLVPKENFRIEEIEKLTVKDLQGSRINLAEYLKGIDRVYLLLFSLNDCSSCVFKSIEDLKMLKEAGKHSVALIISDDIEDVKAWASHYEVITILILGRVDFFENITCAKTPVMVTFEKGKVKGYTLIKELT